MPKLVYIGKTLVSLEHGNAYEVIGVDRGFGELPFIEVVDEIGEHSLHPATDFKDYESVVSIAGREDFL